ncbi:MAG: DHA2 family efflux MFS transporter permease subunit, partial [Nitrospinota bacterium]
AQSLILFRIVQGIGGGPLQPLSLAILYESFPPQQRGMAVGMFNVATAFGLAIGRIVGGYLIETESWRATFYVSVPFGVIGLFMAFLLIPRLTDQSRRPIDFLGLISMATFLISFLLALTQGRQEGWGSAYILTLFGLALFAFLLFILVECSLTTPLVDLRLYRNPNFAIGCLVNFLNTMVFQGLTFLIALFLQRVLPYNPWQVGLLMLPNSIAFGVFSLLSGRLSDLIDPRWAMVLGFTTFALGYYGFSYMTVWTTTGTIIFLLLIRSISYGWTNSPNIYASMQGLPEEMVKMAAGLYNLVRGISGTFGVALCATFLEKRRDVHAIFLGQAQDGTTPVLEDTASGLHWLLWQAGETGEMIRVKTTALLHSLVVREATIQAYHALFLTGALLS